MPTTISDAGRQLREQDLQKLEKSLNAKLPNAYRQFLLSNNGGVPTPDTIDVAGLSESPTDVQEFFGLGTELEESDVRWNRRTYAKSIAKDALPIACDSGGNIFTLSMAGDAAGTISYWDLSTRPAMSFKVAQSFSEFLQKLREFEG